MILITIPTTHILTGKQKSEGGSLRAGKFLVTFPETTSPFEGKITLRQNFYVRKTTAAKTNVFKKGASINYVSKRGGRRG